MTHVSHDTSTCPEEVSRPVRPPGRSASGARFDAPRPRPSRALAGRSLAASRIAAAVLVAAAPAAAQGPSATATDSLPTPGQPVLIELAPAHASVAPGQRSALAIVFRVPKYMWLGARPGVARTPLGTKISMEDVAGLVFENPLYPEPSVEGVPVHTGVTRVYKGEVTVVVPFRVEPDAAEGAREVTARLTYTPGFNAGGLTTHVGEPYTTTIRVQTGAPAPSGPLPEPSVREVPEEYQVQAKRYEFPSWMGPLFHGYQESAFTDVLHTLFIDPPNHGKSIQQTAFPFLSGTPDGGNSTGGGVALLNSTREGVLTGALSALAFDNEYTGLTIGFDYLSCPAAYHNLQITGRVSGDDYSEVLFRYENLTWGENDRWGVQVSGIASGDGRTRFYGLGSSPRERDVSVYDHEEVGATVDFYHTPVERFRVGLGYRYRSVSTGPGIAVDDNGFDRIPNTVDRFPDAIGLEGSTTMGGRFNLIYDGRNQEFQSTKGSFAQFTAEYDRLVDDNSDALTDDYGRFTLDLRHYITSTNKRLGIVFRGQGTATTSEKIPFYEQATLGGPNSLRAFEDGRFYGQHALYGSAEVRYSLRRILLMGFPMEVVAGSFLDAGQVFSNGDEFGDDFNVNPGFTLRFVNPPNVGYIVSFAHGRDGWNATGGMTLPF